MQARTAFIIPGIAFSLASSVYFYFAWSNLDFAFPWFSLGMGLGGLIFLTVGLVLLITPFAQDNKKARLMQIGTPVEVTYFTVDINWRLAINNQHPYRIKAQGVDTLGNQRVFESQDIWFNPQPLLKPGQKMKVYIDPSNPKKYWLDISSLENPTPANPQ